MQTVNDIRSAYLEFFAGNGHQIVPSSPLVPRNDPSLMFTNAGIVQFKNVFTGMETRPYKRATTSQKCVRAGGKHNDLDNVGYTARHHTFFEMLGNFSFGDYFKENAIDFAWRLITKEYGLPADKLSVTVYHTDDEAFDLWKKIAGLPDHRIIRIPTSDNFWQMGDTGPCGPCSEIFYDHGEGIAGGPPGSPEQDGDRFIEIWNLVFMQYEQLPGGERVPLPRPSIDTGMGLERLAAVLQGKHDNYDIDLFRKLIEASAEATGTDPDGPHRVSHRVIADHLRSSSFLIADGVLPSNEGRGYVLRRIMRRAMRHAQLIGAKDPLMWKLVPVLVGQMGQAYPELTRAQSLISETLKIEESRFKVTLDRGLKLLDEESVNLSQGQQLPGEVAFKLYDTYGFPLDLTQDALKGRGVGVDVSGFDAAMNRQKEEARKAWSGSGEAVTEQVWFGIREKTGITEFLGYDAEQAEGLIQAILVDGAAVEKATKGQSVAIIANQTPFYGESGGQVGDCGTITIVGKGVVQVTDTQKKLGDLIVHQGEVVEGEIAVNDAALFVFDAERRNAIRAHHSATHLLHKALRRQLGDHVTQKGSLVGPDRLRFDISHPKAVSAAEMRAIEADINCEIRKNIPVLTRVMSSEEAMNTGAMALFGEKYGDEVRVVSMGEGDQTYSVELCGGVHVARTGDIGLFKILSEGAVASGVRRIEAVVGAAALSWLDGQLEILTRLSDALKAPAAELPARIEQMGEERKRLERDLIDTRRQLATGGAGGGDKQIAGVTFAARSLDGVPGKDLKSMADEIKKQIGSGVIALASAADGKASLVVAVTDDLTGRFSAVDLVRVGAEALGGKGGGGRADMAQAGGPDGAKVKDALSAIEKVLAGQ